VTVKVCYSVAQVCVAISRLREDDATELPLGACAVGGRQHPPQQGTTQQAVETQDLLRVAAGHLLSRPDAQTDARGETPM
jgi:hypothetical protein